MNPSITMLLDLQYGSTGKGLMAAYLGLMGRTYYDTVISANMPNAGHTAYDLKGIKFVHKALPSSIFHNPPRVMIGPGSVFSIEQLEKEINHARDHGYLHSSNIIIHGQAVVLTDDMKKTEEDAACNAIASTAQGSLIAQIRKMNRNPMDKVTAIHHSEKLCDIKNVHVAMNSEWLDYVYMSSNILAEGSQGYSLGLHQDFWPFVTSRDCTPGRFLSDMALPHKFLDKVIGTARTFPIRVGNTDRGTSGPCYPDQRELSWDELEVAPETTTVTGRIRRVFTFSHDQLMEALDHVQPDEVFLNFMNYVSPENRERFVNGVSRSCEECGSKLKYLGYGPLVSDIKTI